jgi:hypothetical protein
MVTCLSMLTSLERLFLGFESPQSFPGQESGRFALPPPTRSVLPTLVAFWSKGVNEYSEDLLAQIGAPRLYRLWITFFNDIFFDSPQLIQSIGCTPTFKSPNEVHVAFNSGNAWFQLQSQASNFERIKVNIPTCWNPELVSCGALMGHAKWAQMRNCPGLVYSHAVRRITRILAARYAKTQKCHLFDLVDLPG